MDAIKVAKVDNVVIRKPDSQSTVTLHLTAHHLIFIDDTKDEPELWVPYPLISLVTRLPQTLNGTSPLAFRCRTFDTFTLYFQKEESASDVFESVKELTVASSITNLYAFFYQPKPAFDVSDGWNLYSPREEFARMGVGSRTKAWRFTDVNRDYSFSSTYPGRLVVPAKISDTVLSHAAKYRSKARIPALTYLHWANYATITRSSQPMVGLTNSRSIQDEKLIEAIFQSHLNPTSAYGGESKGRPVSHQHVYGATATNLIIDARPTTNAMANVAKGAGTEKMEYYKEGKKAYLGIDNIHVMRDSLARVVEALREADALSSASLLGSSPTTTPSALLDRQALRRSGWLKHISAILDGAYLIVRNVHVNSSHVLVHCSDGWDRTAQLASIAEICLDPFYRTLRGFQILVEKDWLSFGHRFTDRCGHLSSEKFFQSSSGDTGGGAGGSEGAQAFFASVQKQFASQGHLKETSPVFHQFLECVRQIQRQFPTRFEFNQLFLQKVHYHLYSCQFGTFLFNNERERRVPGFDDDRPPCERTYSAWDFFNSSPNRPDYLNPQYDPKLDDPMRRDAGADMGVLLPDPRNVRFWHELYGREDEDMNGRIVTGQAVGAELLGVVDSTHEDPVRSNLEEADLSSSPASLSRATASASISRTSSPALPAPAFDSPERKSAPPPPSPRPVPRALQDTFRPYPMSTSAFSMQTEVPLESDNNTSELTSGPSSRSPQPRRTVQDTLAESGTGAVRSLWASVSSGGRAAFTAVQGAYGGVARELGGIAAPSGSQPDDQRWIDGADEMSPRGERGLRVLSEPIDNLSSSLQTQMSLERNPWKEPSTSIPVSTSLPVDPTVSMPPKPPAPARVPSYTQPNFPTYHPTEPTATLSSSPLDTAVPQTASDAAPLPQQPASYTHTITSTDDAPQRQDIDPLGVGFF